VFCIVMVGSPADFNRQQCAHFPSHNELVVLPPMTSGSYIYFLNRAQPLSFRDLEISKLSNLVMQFHSNTAMSLTLALHPHGKSLEVWHFYP
jgi:hypothetical protein